MVGNIFKHIRRRELYFRHIYARVQVSSLHLIVGFVSSEFKYASQGGPTIEQRFESYYNYCKLFNYILSAEAPVNLELPNQWLWEIIDEFIYQFQVNRICDSQYMNILCQAFSQFRSKLAKKTEDEIETLKRNPKVIFELCSERKPRKWWKV